MAGALVAALAGALGARRRRRALEGFFVLSFATSVLLAAEFADGTAGTDPAVAGGVLVATAVVRLRREGDFD